MSPAERRPDRSSAHHSGVDWLWCASTYPATVAYLAVFAVLFLILWMVDGA